MAYSEDIAWRVVYRVLYLGQDVALVADKQYGLSVGVTYINSVLRRYRDTGDVQTLQGKRSAPPANKVVHWMEDLEIMKQLIGAPQVTLTNQHALFCATTGNTIKLDAFCKAAYRLGFTRQKVRAREQ